MSWATNSYIPMNLDAAADLVDMSIRNVYGYGPCNPNPYAYDGDAEYREFNELRASRYASEDAARSVKMWLIGIALVVCVAALLFTL